MSDAARDSGSTPSDKQSQDKLWHEMETADIGTTTDTSSWQDKVRRTADNLNNDILNQRSAANFSARVAKKWTANPVVQIAGLGGSLGALAGIGFTVFESLDKGEPIRLMQLVKHLGISTVVGAAGLSIFVRGLLPMEADPEVRSRQDKYKLRELLKTRDLLVAAYVEDLMKGEGSHQWYNDIKDLVDNRPVPDIGKAR